MLVPLSHVEGQPGHPYALDSGTSHVVGRGSDADFKIPDPHISRRHARVAFVNGEWILSDLSSRHGTFVNGRQLGAGESISLRDSDVISFGEWRCTLRSGGVSTIANTVMDAPRSRIERVDASRLGGLAQDRLEALLDATRRLSSAESSEEIAQVVHDVVRAGTRAERVFVVRMAGETEYEFLAPSDGGDRELSSGLLRRAAQGEVVELIGEQGAPTGQSIVELGIRSAVCAPVCSAGVPSLFVYVDTRHSEQTLHRDAVSFCASIADVAGMAIERLAAADIEARRAQMERDVRAARDAQELLMPRREGTLSAARYAFHSSPGRYVAGDFFDIFELPGGGVAFFLGDVSGKGAGAGVVMAAAQGHLRSLLQHGVDLEHAINTVNTQLCERTRDGTFVTLVAAVWKQGERAVRVADAGHGFICLRRDGGAPETLKTSGGMPLGVSVSVPIPVVEVGADAGVRILLWSDGAVEQCNPDGEQFGQAAAIEAVASAVDVQGEVRALADAVTTYAQGPLADDLTIASIELL